MLEICIRVIGILQGSLGALGSFYDTLGLLFNFHSVYEALGASRSFL
jgi:hypothetical protein